MPAGQGKEISDKFAPDFTGTNGNHSNPILTHRKVVLLLAGHFAGFAVEA